MPQELSPRLLAYHFTSLEALHSIIGEESNQRGPVLRMTGCCFMNDPTEIDHLRNVGGELRLRVGRKGSAERLACHLISMVEKSLVYSASFSGGFESLSQWRAYAGGSGGVAIEFDTSEFPADAVPLPVRYEKPAAPKGERLAELVHAVDREGGIQDSEAAREFVADVIREAVLCKPAEYADERELRSFKYSEDPDGFHVGRYGMTPYIKLHLPSAAVRRVFVSPSAFRISSKLGLKLFLDHCGYDHVEVYQFSTQVRD